MTTGFYLVPRGLMDHPAFGGPSEPFDKRSAFCWLVEHAVWTPTPHDIGGKTVLLGRGQLSYSNRRLASIWGWSEAGVRRFITRLKTDALIDARTDAGRNIITICNYENFSPMPRKSDAPTDAPSDAKVTHDRRTNKEFKNHDLFEGGPPADVNLSGIIFGGCLKYLTATGVEERQARGLLGKWRKASNDGVVIEIITAAERKAVSDPVPWIERGIQSRNPGPKVGIL